MFIVRNLMTKDKIESKIKLSKDEKNSLNYEQLIEDIKSVEDGHGVKYAKKRKNKLRIIRLLILLMLEMT